MNLVQKCTVKRPPTSRLGLGPSRLGQDLLSILTGLTILVTTTNQSECKISSLKNGVLTSHPHRLEIYYLDSGACDSHGGHRRDPFAATKKRQNQEVRVYGYAWPSFITWYSSIPPIFPLSPTKYL